MSHLYTRTGDTGMTSLVGGQRVPKTHIRLEAYGTVDELNSHLGLLLSYLNENTYATERDTLLRVQNLLFSIGSMLATDTRERDVRPGRYITQEDVEDMEHAIDAAEEGLPGWRGFILPGGSPGAAQAHICRTVCRRAERRIHALAAEADVDPLLLAYMNRLSDYLFVLARRINKTEAVEDIIWQKRKKSEDSAW
ncbi:MAG: cob(I)yrinic acid a,c-diamide adenosyltransferase [Bacteroidaceae bacterium]|nr:cob(I)yrinic acid a,c-diamide adenosyltransferase [Bacteroidaceae bacterium]